jgi:trehalose 6-phosphate synthase/phosphatase
LCVFNPICPTRPLQVVPGQSIVEVKPQGVSKGKVVERILHDAAVGPGGGPPDFVLCIGNDRSGAYWCTVFT